MFDEVAEMLFGKEMKVYKEDTHQSGGAGVINAWKRCEDERPIDGEEVLTWDGKCFWVAWMDNCDNWETSGDPNYESIITHWMPLPESPLDA